MPKSKSKPLRPTRRNAHEVTTWIEDEHGRRSTIEALPPLLYEVVRYRGFWRVLHLKKHSPPFANQTAAISAARKAATEKRQNGHLVEILLQRTDGRTVVHTVDT